MGEDEIILGLPPEDTPRKQKISFLLLFGFIGLVIACTCLFLGIVDWALGNITSGIYIPGSQEIYFFISNLVLSSLYSFVLVLCVASLQVAIFISRKIRIKWILFLTTYAVSGIVGGFIGGLITNVSGMFFGYDLSQLSNLLNQVIPEIPTQIIIFGFLLVEGGLVGSVVGAIIGCLSSLAQFLYKWDMINRYKWLFYQLISWILICGIGWSISFGIGRIVNIFFIADAIAIGIMILVHGISLVLFLKFNPQIELP